MLIIVPSAIKEMVSDRKVVSLGWAEVSRRRIDSTSQFMDATGFVCEFTLFSRQIVSERSRARSNVRVNALQL